MYRYHPPSGCVTLRSPLQASVVPAAATDLLYDFAFVARVYEGLLPGTFRSWLVARRCPPSEALTRAGEL